MDDFRAKSLEIFNLIRDLTSFEGEDRGPTTRFLIWNLLFIALGAVGTREYKNVKLRTRQKQSWTAWAALVTSVMLLLSCVLESRAISLGHGRHASSLYKEELLSIAVISRLADMFVTLSIFWSKLFAISVLQPNVSSAARLRLLLDVVIVASALGMAAATVLASVPVDKVYCPAGGEACVSLETFVFAAKTLTAYSCVLNIIIVSAAAVVVSKLLLERKQLAGAIVVVALGACSTVAAGVRHSKYSELDDGDFTYHGAFILLWSAAEAALMTVAASLPSVHPYQKKNTAGRPSSPPPEAVPLRNRRANLDAERGQSSDTDLQESEVLYRSMVRAGLL
ncbi:unnamed protein product [Parascedosporium putredinis]|uniref:Rhodopsin domain-containing protein n=1 Tax=Parascedosporium putredinis TaxID=1442378 RepID=A0A9P1H109_9PEZI|nr:unnamed protein product [Parascedosporium putredinis]CAI7994681.1 unnamed protein product [Parascedosporium putredinis]